MWSEGGGGWKGRKREIGSSGGNGLKGEQREGSQTGKENCN